MGLFKRVGRQVEQFKQTAKNAAEEDATYQCQGCGKSFDTQHDQCPSCGAETVTSMRTEE